jgi:hypothetical protein
LLAAPFLLIFADLPLKFRSLIIIDSIGEKCSSCTFICEVKPLGAFGVVVVVPEIGSPAALNRLMRKCNRC